MKKVIAIAFIGGLVLASCAKKETKTESNVMLSEPETSTTDDLATESATVVDPAIVDSTAAK